MDAITLYHGLPYHLKTAATSLAGFYKSKQKYGRYFQTQFSFLSDSDARQREQKALYELDKFIAFQRNNSTFYRNKIVPGGGLEQIPVMTKTDALRNYGQLAAPKRTFLAGKTSGTTGQPLVVPYSKNVYQKEFAFWWYHRSFGKVRLGDKVATVAGHKIVSINRDKPPFWVNNFSENQILFSSYHLSPKNIKAYVKALVGFRPRLINGYPSSLYLIAHYILDNSIEIPFQPRMIVTASETTYPFQRKVIQEAFKCKVYNWYGNIEFCGHISECAFGKLHVQPYHSHVRILKDNGAEAKAGETGRIVATNFTNYAFPLINYDTKDMASVSADQTCSCNGGGLIVQEIEGRYEDHIVTPEGRIVVRLGHVFKNAEHVRNAQIEQVSMDTVIIRIEKNPLFKKATEKKILKEARSRLGHKIDIHFDYVDEIPKDKNGKFKFILQKKASGSSHIANETANAKA